MGRSKQEKKLYGRMRASGVRKKVARQLTELHAHATKGRKAPKPLRQAVGRLEKTVDELRSHVASGDRSAAGRKAARTRRAKRAKRRAAGRKAARSRA
jgi:hypothetical protein